MKKYKDIKKELRMGDAEIAADFGYKTRESFTKSSAKPRIETGLEKFYDRTIKKQEEVSKALMKDFLKRLD